MSIRYAARVSSPMGAICSSRVRLSREALPAAPWKHETPRRRHLRGGKGNTSTLLQGRGLRPAAGSINTSVCKVSLRWRCAPGWN